MHLVKTRVQVNSKKFSRGINKNMALLINFWVVVLLETNRCPGTRHFGEDS